MSEKDNLKLVTENQHLRDVHDSMLDGLGQLADYFGFSKVMGQLFATLLLAAEPLSLDDMMERLAISKASVSMNVRALENMGMVRQVWVRGGSGRRKYYEAEHDFWDIFTNLMTGREMRDVDRAIHIMDENTEQLESAFDSMTQQEQQMAILYIQRMQQVQSLFRFAQMIIARVIEQVDDDNFKDISSINLD